MSETDRWNGIDNALNACGGGMVRGTRKGIWLLTAMVALFMLALGTAASAQQPGPTPPELGDPVDDNQVVPHGGYSSTTNFCMQCHDVHDATGAYALMANASVEATCSTCHSVYGGGTSEPVGGPDPGGTTPNALGTVSSRTAYDTTEANGAQATHTLGDPDIPGGGFVTQSDWAYKLWTEDGGPVANATTPAGKGTSEPVPDPDDPDNIPPTYGLYCATCHTPHGEYGQIVNNWTPGNTIWFNDEENRVVDVDDNSGTWYVCAADWVPLNDGPPSFPTCDYAQVQDAEKQLVSLYGYKLLTAYPNHTYLTAQSYNTTLHYQDSADWCSTCHVEQGTGSGLHNHKGTCNSCHGNPTDQTPVSMDFPHTSTGGSFLIDFPDALCITCHTEGSLP